MHNKKTHSRNKVAVTVYVDQEMYDFIDAVRWGTHSSKTEQMEEMFIDWRERWIEEHGGEEGVKTIRRWAKEGEARAVKRRRRRAGSDRGEEN